MATGVRPVWGDGRTDPIHLSDVVPRLDAELFDPSVRDGMLRFFERALHRSPAQRFDTADQMRQAWRAVFSAASNDCLARALLSGVISAGVCVAEAKLRPSSK